MSERALPPEQANAPCVDLVKPAFTNTRGAAHYAALSPKQLEHWRTRGCGPTYIKVGRHVRYSYADLDAWMAARRVANTAQEVRP